MAHITVTIPVFNRAHLVGPTIGSVLNQTYQDFDVLAVDDASTDATADVIGSICKRDHRVRLVVNAENLGLTRNWNGPRAFPVGERPRRRSGISRGTIRCPFAGTTFSGKN